MENNEWTQRIARALFQLPGAMRVRVYWGAKGPALASAGRLKNLFRPDDVATLDVPVEHVSELEVTAWFLATAFLLICLVLMP